MHHIKPSWALHVIYFMQIFIFNDKDIAQECGWGIAIKIPKMGHPKNFIFLKLEESGFTIE